jgi:hypothetical protein
MTGTEYNPQTLKDRLPRGYGPILQARTKKSLPYIYDVLNGNKFNEIVLTAALKLVNEQASAKEQLVQRLQQITQVA